MIAHTRASKKFATIKNKELKKKSFSKNSPEQKQQLDLLSTQLQTSLLRAAAVESIIWSYSTKDWVVGVYAADIDNDGDIEILVGSRDGYVRALTRRNEVKWEMLLQGYHISTVFGIAFSPAERIQQPFNAQARVLIGTREGSVFALDGYGDLIHGWHYDTTRMIRQIYVSTNTPDRVVVGSEDRCVHILDRATGKPVSEKYQTNGWIRSVFVYDIDKDGKDEVLAGSGDKYLYILDTEGKYLDKFFVGHQIYAIFSASLNVEGQIDIITSSNRKDLTVWEVQKRVESKRKEKRWHFEKRWEKSPHDNLFANRVHSIYVTDINDDKQPEILVGSEDGHLYILDQYGNLLWKRWFDSCIYSVHALDIDLDGQVEIIVGTESNGATVLRIDIPTTNLYEGIKETYQKLSQYQSMIDINKHLTIRERRLLWDIVQPSAPLQHKQMEMSEAIKLMETRHYKTALSIFLRLLQQKVQYYWDHPAITRGYVWTVALGNVAGDRKNEILVGTDEGYVSAFDVQKNSDKQLWSVPLGDRVRMLHTNRSHSEEYDTFVAVLANHRVVLLDKSGTVVRDFKLPDKQDWARCVSVYQKETGNEILIGQENQQVSIWSADLAEQIDSIRTPQGINIVSSHDITGNNTAEIISGSIHNQVYVHHRNGELIWMFDTEDRVQAIRVADIDKDGHAEVIVGSEDRNVYVLDYQGNLKWRYWARRGVMDVDVCDVKMESDSASAEERKLKVLVSSADGYLYMLSAEGDLLWQYKSNNRIRAVRVEDINNDGKIEIAIASENQVELLQIIDRNELLRHIDYCWDQLIDSKDRRNAILKLTYDENEYIRALALARLAGQHARHPDDFKRLQEALEKDDSQQVKRELARAIVNLCKVPSYHEANTRQARQFLQKLSADPDPEIRLAVVNVLQALVTDDENLCFEYLEHFGTNVDPWIRRAVVRQLDKLVAKYPRYVFRILVKMSSKSDEHAWLQQEIGRVFAHYFDVHPAILVQHMLTLLYGGTSLALLQQIAHSAKVPAVQHLFQVLVQLLQPLHKKNLETVLEEAVTVIQEVNALEPLYGEELFQIYEEFLLLLRTKTIDAIARYPRLASFDTKAPVASSPSIKTIFRTFAAFQDIIHTIRLYERREATGDRFSTLIRAIEIIDKALNELRYEELQYIKSQVTDYHLPEYVILTFLLEQWTETIKTKLARLRGKAHLVLNLPYKQIRPAEIVDVSLRITNSGRSAADNVQVWLEPNEHFSIVESDKHELNEVATNHPATVCFSIRPYTPTIRLSFKVSFEDAEGKDKHFKFADLLFLEGMQKPYRHIPNPYTSGTPIRDNKDMFYGRQEDLQMIKEKLSSIEANKVVVLVGQRRMGKTSLIYQLIDELSLCQESYTPILIDMQALALYTNAGQLFEGIAMRIREVLLKRRGISIAEPQKEAFLTNSTSAFENYLESATQALLGGRLVLIFDEFEKLLEKIQQNQLNADLPTYLRSLMQHRRGLNFLLAGAPNLRNHTEGYFSTFFNIGQYHTLKKLKPDEAEALISEPVKEYLDYDPLAITRMRKLTGDQPFLIHVMSERLIAHCNQHQKTYVTTNDVNAALAVVLEEQKSSIIWIWVQSTPMERFLLSIIAQDEGKEGRIFSLTDIWQEYDIQGVPYEKELVTVALKNLVNEGFIEEMLDGNQFRIPVGLMKEWLRKYQPPERVALEEMLDDKE